MYQFFVEPQQIHVDDKSVTITGNDVNHIKNVLRMKIGEEIAHVGLKMSGCHGFCEMGPLVRIEPYNYLYLKVKLEDCEEIFEKTILRGEPVTRLMYEDSGRVYETQEEIPFYAKQTRLVLKNCGHIDAEHIEDAMAAVNAAISILFFITISPF